MYLCFQCTILYENNTKTKQGNDDLWLMESSAFTRLMTTTNRCVCNICDFSLQPNTFQLVIAYDPSRYQTYVMYVYKDIGWNNEYIVRRSMIGHLSLKHTEEKSLQLAPSKVIVICVSMISNSLQIKAELPY